MQKEIRIVDHEKQIIQVTTLDERWYAKPDTDLFTGLPTFSFVPSSTWIAGQYPKGIGFYKWLADKGWDEAEALKVAGGIRGNKVHKASEILERNGNFPIDTLMMNPETQQPEMLSTEELGCIFSFAKWYNETKPELLASEMTVFGDGYGGTLDRIYRINGIITILDLKTSQQIWEEMILQVSSYSHADIDYKSLGITDDEWKKRQMAILQVGYRLNKAGFKFTQIEDKYDLFQVARKIWANENENARPKQKDYPLVITLNKEVLHGSNT